jgi:hypothetical protein
MGDGAGLAEEGNRQRRGRMTPEQWKEVKEVLAGALELAPEKRRAYLDRRCADGSLRREVESLIAAHENGGGFIDALAAEPGPGLARGDKLGTYEILGAVGAGGMARFTARVTRN